MVVESYKTMCQSDVVKVNVYCISNVYSKLQCYGKIL